MSLGQSLLPEFDHEMFTLRKTLERVPFDKAEFKPHPTSMTMLHLAAHIVNMLYWTSGTMQSTSVDIATLPPPEPPKSLDELLATFDTNRETARAALAAASDSDFMVPWALLNHGQPIFELPRIAVVRTMIMNHLIHHRGQLSVYLRMNGVPIPSIYGPSGDES